MSERGELTEQLVVSETPEEVVESAPTVASEHLKDDGRIAVARRYNAPDDTPWPELSRIAFERNRLRAAENLGLPSETPMEEIKRVGPDIVLQERREQLGLPPDATWNDVQDAKEARRKASRKPEADADLEVAA